MLQTIIPAWLTTKTEYSINLKLDNGKEYCVSSFWCGFFEGLYGVDVIKLKDEGEKLGFDYW